MAYQYDGDGDRKTVRSNGSVPRFDAIDFNLTIKCVFLSSRAVTAARRARLAPPGVEASLFINSAMAIVGQPGQPSDRRTRSPVLGPRQSALGAEVNIYIKIIEQLCPKSEPTQSIIVAETGSRRGADAHLVSIPKCRGDVLSGHHHRERFRI